MLLARLLRTLSDDEIEKVRKDFRLSERSRLLFERIAVSPEAPPDASELAKAFRISTENLYRIFSEIVDECVRILAAKDEFATLKFFRSKYLYRPYVTEAQRIEKRLLEEKDREVLERFYAYMFQSIKDFPLDLFDLDLLEEFGMKWHKIRTDPPVDDALHIQIKVIFTRIAALPTRKKMNLEQMASYARKLLDSVADRASKSSNPHVQFEYYQAEWKACIYERTDPYKYISWLDRCLEVIKAHPSYFDAGNEQSVKLQIAYQLGSKCGKPKESLVLYKKIYAEQTAETSRRILFMKNFSHIALLAKDFETSHQILEKLIQNKVVRTTTSIYVFTLLTKTLLEIVEGSPETAAKTIVTVKELNHESYFLAYEIQIRALEAVIALKQKDYALADQLCERNIKWLRSRRIALATSAWIYFYQMIIALINFSMKGEPIRISLLDHFNKELQAEHPEYCLLLENDIAIASENTQ